MNTGRTALRWVSLSFGAIIAALSVLSAQTSSPDRLLVLLRDASALAIVDPETRMVLGRVPTGRDPHEVTASADGRHAFVTSMVDGISVPPMYKFHKGVTVAAGSFPFEATLSKSSFGIGLPVSW